MYLRRKDIDKSRIQEEVVKLRYTRHAMDRLKERTNGSLLLYPKILKKSASNINFIDTAKMSWGYSIKFNNATAMILVLNEKDIVKTIYFKDAKFGRNKMDERKETRI